MIPGSCLCGQVRYEVSEPFSMMGHCHCSICRKHHGAMFATFVAVPGAQFKWRAGEKSVGSYETSPGGSRSFCRVCGSVTPLELPQAGIVFASAGNLEGDLEARPQSHIFVKSKAPGYEITDVLPQYDAYPPGFDAPPVERPVIERKEGVVQGSCLCGDVAYEMAGLPLRVHNCHCSRCRRARSAAHATNAAYPLAQFRWVRGEERIVDYRAPGARYFGIAFCKRCGGAVARISQERGFVVVPVGALDSDPQLQPQRHIFVGSKANWFEITDRLPQFSELPPS
jgi:hypothetical protein